MKVLSFLLFCCFFFMTNGYPVSLKKSTLEYLFILKLTFVYPLNTVLAHC